MKYILSLVAVLAVCSGFTFSHGTPAKQHGPLLVIDTANSNFGAVPNVGYAKRTFLLMNKGDAPLHITQVRPTCGCTIAALADSTVAPGRSTPLLVSLSAAHRSGNFFKNIYITSNSSGGAGQWLKFYGHFVNANPPSAHK